MTTRRGPTAFVCPSGGDVGGGDHCRRGWVELRGDRRRRRSTGNHERARRIPHVFTDRCAPAVAGRRAIRQPDHAGALHAVRPQGGTDEYRCVILDPHLTTPTFLSGSQFQPQNTPMVHHAIVFAVPPENAAAAHAKDAATPGQGWTCFGDDGMEGEQPSAWVDTWAPGATETLLQQDVGLPAAARQPAGSSDSLQPARHRRRHNGPVQRSAATDRRHSSHQTAGHGAVAGTDGTALRGRRVRAAVRPRRGNRGRHPALRRRSRRDRRTN